MEKLKKLRLSKGLKHKDMGELLKISKPYYWQIENNKRNLSYEMAIKIASIFNMRPDDIFYDEYTKKEE